MRAVGSMVVLTSLAFMAGCGGDTASVDAGGGDDAASADAGAVDGGFVDAASEVDAGSVDAATSVDAAVAVDSATAADTGTPVAFTLTSSAYFEGGVIPLTHVCTDQGGDNASPPLAWVGAPVGTLSFGVFFRDVSTDFPHSAIFDIPSSRTELPANIEHIAMPMSVPGARQPRGYPGTAGYAGPCPGSMHSYRFTLYALDVATLPGVTGGTSVEALEALEIQFMAHSLGTATLTGTHTPPPRP